MYDDLKYLSVPLPEDIQHAKNFGDFALVRRLIENRLASERTPYALRKRFELENEILDLIPDEYPYSEEQALTLLRDTVGEFSEDDFAALWQDGRADWIYIDGRRMFKDDFLSNLLKIDNALAERARGRGKLEPLPKGPNLLDETMRFMKENGGISTVTKIQAHMTVTPEEADGQKLMNVWLPVPAELSQIKNVRITDTDADFIAEGSSLQRTAYFSQRSADSLISVTYEYETHLRYMDPDPLAVTKAQPTFYLEEQAPHIRFTPYLRELAAQIVGNETNPLLKARKIYDFITQNVRYSYMRAYFTMPMIPEYAATNLKGDCGVQALLFITLCRICGIPAKWQSGLYAYPGSIGCHDWAQFYVAPFGWMFCDCSFGGGALRSGNLERWDFYFCNLDPYRMPANNEYQHDFEVPPRFLRHDPYDNQLGEAEYLDRPVPRSTRRTHHHMISMKTGNEALDALIEERKG